MMSYASFSKDESKYTVRTRVAKSSVQRVTYIVPYAKRTDDVCHVILLLLPA